MWGGTRGWTTCGGRVAVHPCGVALWKPEEAQGGQPIFAPRRDMIAFTAALRLMLPLAMPLKRRCPLPP